MSVIEFKVWIIRKLNKIHEKVKNKHKETTKAVKGRKKRYLFWEKNQKFENKKFTEGILKYSLKL